MVECKIVAEDLSMVSNGLSIFPEKRRRQRVRFVDETLSDEIRDFSPEDCFKRDVFYALLDCVIGNMARRFEAAKDLEATFGMVWRYSTLDREETHERLGYFA